MTAELYIMTGFTYCIAHQDYTLQERINLVENPGFLYYANGGSFIPGTVQKALATHGPQRHYRNECLCNAMVNFNMIDIVGRGIRKIFNQQWVRRFPMPDYEIDAAKKEVAVRLYGNAINEKYTKLLKENKDLSFEDCLLLDAVQKGGSISIDDAHSLQEKGLLEGDYPNLYLSESVSIQTDQLGDYVKNRGMKRQYYKDVVLELLKKKPDGVKRSEIDNLLMDMIPKSSKNPSVYIGRLLNEMKEKDGFIHFSHSFWFINDEMNEK